MADTWAMVALYAFLAGTVGVFAAAGLSCVHLVRTRIPTPVRGASRPTAQAPAGATSYAGARLNTVAVWLAFGALTVSLIARGLAAGRPPLGSQYEFAIAFAWGAIAVYLALAAGRAAPGLTVAVLAAALVPLLYASTLPSAVLPTVPALQNNLLMALHVGAAVVAYGANAVAFGAAALYLVQSYSRARRGRPLAWLPGERFLDEIGFRAVAVSFPMLAATLLLGSWWASIAWGVYWNWDPKENATLATWLIYGIYLHTRITREWQGRGSALLLIAGFGGTVFTYLGNLFFDSLHSYSGL